MDEYQKMLEKNFKSEAKKVDFKLNAEDARRTINSFVSDKTNNMIPEVIAAGQHDSLSHFLLINSVYFKGIN